MRFVKDWFRLGLCARYVGISRTDVSSARRQENDPANYTLHFGAFNMQVRPKRVLIPMSRFQITSLHSELLGLKPSM